MIYTKTGDKGTTGIFGGERVPKDDVRVEAYGTMDELNAVIGMIRTFLPEEDERQTVLYDIQMRMMAAMSIVATPAGKREQNPNHFPEEAAANCEAFIDMLLAETTDNGYFILPGGTPLSAHLQLARTIARRVERRLWTLHRSDEVPDAILKWMNRLSDLFFVMARHEMQQQGWSEEKWHRFAYKRKKK